MCRTTPAESSVLASVAVLRVNVSGEDLVTTSRPQRVQNFPDRKYKNNQIHNLKNVCGCDLLRLMSGQTAPATCDVQFHADMNDRQ